MQRLLRCRNRETQLLIDSFDSGKGVSFCAAGGIGSAPNVRLQPSQRQNAAG